MINKPKRTNPVALKIGISLLIIACLSWLSLVIISFLPISYPQKASLGAFVLVAGEVVFWLGALLTGKEFVSRYKRYFNPRNWKK